MRQKIKHFVIFFHPSVAASETLAREIAAGLETQHGVEAKCAITADIDRDDILQGADMLVAVGGDGTILRVGRIGAHNRCPVLGIDLGRRGFLFEVKPDGWQAALAQVLAGDYWLEERMLVYAEHWQGEACLEKLHALNEVVIARGALARPVRLETRIDSSELTTYVADGLIVSTPTGSTAYALAAGGPILPPELRNMVIIPVAPHLSMDRAIVLAQGAEIDIVVRSDHQAILSADGQVEIELQHGDRMHVCASKLTAQFVRLQDRSYFYTNLTAHMMFRGQRL